MATPEPKTSSVHSELHHYTKWNGVAGILRSQCLRATRYDRMNDPGEIVYAAEFLLQALAPRIEGYIAKRRLTSSKVDKWILAQGGIKEVVRRESETWIKNHYTASTTTSDGAPFAIPYITSFCTHSAHDSYERENGLLSQWRGYGDKEAAYALVFDTVKLEQLLKHEYGQYHYVTMRLCDVHYAKPNYDLLKEHEELVSLLTSTYVETAEGKAVNRDQIFPLFLRATDRIKHQAFYEESEVRIVAYPLEESFFSKERSDGPLVKEKQLKNFHSDPKPHISLFEASGEQLPISRIIVGPNESNSYKMLVDLLDELGLNIQVHQSKTPFRLTL